MAAQPGWHGSKRPCGRNSSLDEATQPNTKPFLSLAQCTQPKAAEEVLEGWQRAVAAVLPLARLAEESGNLPPVPSSMWEGRTLSYAEGASREQQEYTVRDAMISIGTSGVWQGLKMG